MRIFRLFFFFLFSVSVAWADNVSLNCYWDTNGYHGVDSVSVYARWHVSGGVLTGSPYLPYYDRGTYVFSAHGLEASHSDGVVETMLLNWSPSVQSSWKDSSQSMKEGYTSGTVVCSSGTFLLSATPLTLVWSPSSLGISGTNVSAYQDVYARPINSLLTAVFPYSLTAAIGDGQTYHVALYVNNTLYSSVPLSGTMTSNGTLTYQLPTDYQTSSSTYSFTWVLVETNQPLGDTGVIPHDTAFPWTAPTLVFTESVSAPTPTPTPTPSPTPTPTATPTPTPTSSPTPYSPTGSSSNPVDVKTSFGNTGGNFSMDITPSTDGTNGSGGKLSVSGSVDIYDPVKQAMADHVSDLTGSNAANFQSLQDSFTRLSDQVANVGSGLSDAAKHAGTVNLDTTDSPVVGTSAFGFSVPLPGNKSHWVSLSIDDYPSLVSALAWFRNCVILIVTLLFMGWVYSGIYSAIMVLAGVTQSSVFLPTGDSIPFIGTILNVSRIAISVALAVAIATFIATLPTVLMGYWAWSSVPTSGTGIFSALSGGAPAYAWHLLTHFMPVSFLCSVLANWLAVWLGRVWVVAIALGIIKAIPGA